MIKAISNLTNSTMHSFKTPLRSANADRSTHTPTSRSGRLRCALLRRVALLGLIALLSGVQHTWGQSVIMSDNSYYLKHNDEGSSLDGTATTGFTPSKCIWFINSNTVRTANANGEAFDGNNYLQTGNASLGSSATWVQAQNGSNLIATNGNYLRRRNSNSAWTIDGTNNHRATAYAVTTSSVIGTFSVSGDATITVTGTNSSYSHTNANYYDIYTFNSLTYYSKDLSAEATTTAPTSGLPTLTSGYTWNISSNSYATVNSSTGAITVNSLPANDTNVTLICSITRNGITQTATKTVTIEAPKVDPTGITIPSGVTMTVYVGNTENITYSLQPTPCYNNVTFSSANTGVATVNGSGVVTGVSVGTTTITVNAHKIDGTTTDALTKTITVTVKNKVATPIITFTPDENDYTKATATITCSTPGTTIYYTTNGNNPTSGDQNYTSSFTVNENQEIMAIAVKTTDATYWDDSDVASETYVSCTTAAPTISYIQSSGSATVTITAEDGATIYYTTNGNAPTTSSTNGTTSVTINNISSGTTVKAFAKNGTCQASDIVEKDIITSGTSGGVVTLYDYEDHNWSYYSDPDCPIRSLNPADVKITYNGNGTGTVQSNTNSDTPSTWGADATTVKVGIDADASTFVYYKTLERTDGSTAASVDAATGRCAYTTIPNPFSVRPTYDSDGTSKYRGFYAWRVKALSGGTIHSAATGGTSYTVGSIINAETEIYFAPSSSTGMEVEFEALWARARVSTSSTPSYNLGVERNFYVITASATSNITAGSYPCTYTSIYPNGTTDGTTPATSVTVYKYGGFTASADSKIEYIILRNNNSTINASGKNLTIGRGVTGYNNGYCTGTLYGINSTASSATSYKIRVESGSFNNFNLCGYSSGSNNQIRHSNTFSAVAVFGCDYDRATGNNENLSISGTIYGGQGLRFTNQANRNNLTIDWYIKSGTVQGGILGDADGGTESIYLGSSHYDSQTADLLYFGKRRLTMEGGDVASIAGGVDDTNNNNSTPNDGDYSVLMRIKGGTIRGSVYGAAAYSGATGDRCFIFTGGTINGWIAGGANGTQSDGGLLTGASHLYVGGNTKVDSNNSSTVINRAIGGNVFGAGCGYSATSSSGQVSAGTTVVIADGAYVERGVYGGGSYGYTTNTSNIYVLGGHVGGANGGVSGTAYSASITGGVFGGACQNQGGTVNITMTDGLVEGGVYGGSNATGTVTGPVTIHVNGGQVGTSSNNANIHGGGYGSATVVSGNVDLTIGAQNAATGATIYGDVYGGSALGKVNGTNANTTYHTNVTLNAGTINGSLYGGALGDNSTAANVYGPVQVKVYGGSVRKTDANGANGSGGVYGANNVNGAPQRSVTVDIYGTDPAPSENEYALYAVYGGGNAADYTYGNGYPTVTVHNCDNSIEYVYGGGNAAAVAATNVTIYGGDVIGNVFGGGNGTVNAANVTGNTVTNIYGGTILKVFGGSNSQGTIGGTITVNAESQTESGTNPLTGTAFQRCPIQVGELYGGGNMANSNAGAINIGCMEDGDMIDYVYGGANQADITGNIALTMTGGRIGNLFGGNNTSGDISGTIAVTVNWDNSCTTSYLGNVFGGGNLATYTGSPTVNIYNGTVTENVYGGGAGELVDGAQRGTKGKVTGNPTVTIGDNDNNHTATVIGDVYGGGDAADVDGTPVIVVNDCNTQIGNLYGGGNAADVNGTDITVNGGTIGDAFGGGHGDKDASNPSKYADVNGDVTFNVKGGTIARVFAGSNSRGTITGTSSLTINKDSSCDMKIGEVYGGGNEADGVASTINIGCTGTLAVLADGERYGYEQEGIGYVYGGANQANIGTAQTPSNIEVNITSGIVANVFGGNNTSGTINGTITVNIEKNNNATCADEWYVGNVFGGGNQAAYTGSPAVNIKNGTVSGNVFGGGLGATAVVTGNPAVTIGDATAAYAAVVSGDVYGGGDAAAVSGTPTVLVINKSNTSIANVYGGGNAADVDGTSVTIHGGTVTGMVFGGGHGNKDAQPATAANVNGDVAVTVTGGTINKVFGGSNSMGNITGSISVTVEKGDASGDMHITELYGGGNEAAGNAGSINIICTGTESEGIGDVYGGANAADINSDITLNISGGNINRVFGGNNTSGAINGNVAVNVNWNTTTPCGYSHLGSVFGGGNLASYAGTPVVTLTNGTVSHSVYGGGNEAGVGGSQVNINGGRVMDGVYGGCNTSGTVTGDIAVNINAGTLGVSGTPLTSGIFGGGYGDATATQGNVTVTIGDLAGSHAPTIYGDIYGGSALGNVNDDATDLTKVDFLNGTLYGNMYGGGLGQKTPSPIAAKVYGKVQVNIGADGQSNCAIDLSNASVFGGNNTNGSPQDDIEVNVWCTGHDTKNAAAYTGIDATYAIDQVFGGGNQADYAPEDGLATSAKKAKVYIHGCLNTVRRLFGGGNAAAAVGLQTIIDGGRFDYVFGGGNGEVTAANIGKGGTDLQIHGGHINMLFGGSNASGTITGPMGVSIDSEGGCPDEMNIEEFFCGNNLANIGTADNPVDINATIGCGTKFGAVYGGCNLADIYGNVTLTIEGGTMDYVYGGSKGRLADNTDPSNPIEAKAADINGNVILNIYGGQIGDAFGGSNINGNITGSVTVNMDWSQASTDCNTDLSLGNVYGGSNLAAYTPTTAGNYPAVNIYHGTVTHSVFGGGKGATAVVTSNPIVTIGDDNANHYAVVTENVYGGGDAAAVTGNTRVLYNDNNASSTVNNLFGGGNAAGVSGTATVTLTSGKVLTGIYGGCNASGTVGGAIALNINGGLVGTDANNMAYGIFGGGKGSDTRTGDAVTVTIGTATDAQTYPTIYGDVYGGSAEGQVNDALAEITKVWLKKGVINGDLYGGGFGDNGANALVNGSVQVVVDGGTVTGKVFGANNANGTPLGTVNVTINGTDTPAQGSYALSEVYGGGNMANYNPTNITPATVVVNGCDNSIGVVYGGGNAADVPETDVTIWGGTIGQVFGGGHGNKDATPATEANVVKRGDEGGNVAVKIYGGTITEVFGGSNSKGNIEGASTVTIEENGGSCTFNIGDVYGGGNQAAGNAGTLSIGCGAVITGNVYGGAKEANVNNDIHLEITGGTLHNVFGGNNIGGTIAGTITVDINQDNSCSSWHVDNVYGGGNLAAYSAPQDNQNYPAVNIMNGTVSGSVFGGGYGASATVTANPQVTVTGGTISQDVFGGGEQAPVSGNPTVLFTGGQAANVYGGGKQANVTGNNTVRIEGGTVTTDVYGGGMQGDVSGNVTVNISKSGTPDTVVIGRDVYGGGALANTNTGNIDSETKMTTDRNVTVVNLYPGATIGHDVYGGGRGQKASGANPAIEAIVYGNVSVYQYGAVLTATYNSEGLASGGRIFGGNNVNGTPKGHILVYVVKTTDTTNQQRSSQADRADANATHTYELAAVYGGGNEAEYNPDSDTDFAEVRINGCNDVSIHSVYGGGNAASTPATMVTIDGAYEIEYVFGGGNGAGTGNPGANVGYHAYPENVSGTDQIADRAGYIYGSGLATTNIYGGRIHHIYGGSNTRGNVRETAVAMLDEVNDCPLVVDGIYGGGREAYMEGNANLELGCITGMDELYGGSEKADVGNSVELTLTSGHFGKVFGGNNKGGRIFGSIKVNIEQTGCIPITIDELYLGGNNAPYSVYGYTDNAYQVVIDGESVTHYQLNESDTTKYPDPELNIRSFESIGTVYGGGKGEPATMVGNPIVDINVTQGWVNGMYVGDVPAYIQYKQKPAILSTDGVIGTVFGGGNAADVIGNTEIRVGDKMGSNVDLKSMQSLIGTLSDDYDIKSGIKMQKESDKSIKFTAVDADGNDISGTDPLTVGVSQKVNGAVIQDNIYGGGNQAVVTGGTNTVVGPANQ